MTSYPVFNLILSKRLIQWRFYGICQIGRSQEREFKGVDQVIMPTNTAKTLLIL